MQDNTVAILGAGSMGTAILTGMIKGHIKPEHVKATARRVESANALARKFGVTAYATAYQPNANALSVPGAKTVLVS